MKPAPDRDGYDRDPEDERRISLDDILDVDAGAVQHAARGVEIPGLVAPDRLHEKAGHRHSHHYPAEERQGDRRHEGIQYAAERHRGFARYRRPRPPRSFTARLV